MKHHCGLLCVFLSFACIDCSLASAGVMLSFAPSLPSPLSVGSSGTIDVLIHSNASDVLDSFQVSVTLAPVGPSPAGGVKFSASQLDPQLTETNYVFFGNSLSKNLPQPVGGVNAAGDLFAGYDATFDFVPVSLTGTDQLLFRLHLDAFAAGTYQIDIRASLSLFATDQLDPLNTPLAFSSTPGTITVEAAAAAVPEPSSAVILGLACGCGCFFRRKLRQISTAG